MTCNRHGWRRARAVVAAALLLTAARTARAQPVPKPADLAAAWGDQGDGTFVNPVLPGDFSDLDAIRVGDDFYAISSTIHLSPGMAVLHSRDLVGWQIVGHAVADAAQVDPGLSWDRMDHYGRGIWAGAIRHHDGKYWVYLTSPDTGIFVTTATDPVGPWEPPHAVWKVSGYDDPCPFWDDDGQGYLVTTNFAKDPANGRNYNIHLFKLTADGRGLVAGSGRIIHQSRGSEANKLYKVDGRYYHFYSEVRPEGRVVMMERATTLAGPWESRQLNHVGKADKNPNQGGLVQLASGPWWFVTHQGAGDWEGRAMCLLPVTWTDGWPIIGRAGADGIGNMVWRAAKPIAGQPVVVPQTDDEFDRPTLAPEWEWNHEPRADKWSLTERPGFLRLHAFRPLRPGDLLTAGNTLSQRSYRTAANEVTVKLDVSGMADGQSAGLCHFSRAYATIGVTQARGARTLAVTAVGRVTRGQPLTGPDLWLRSAWNLDGDGTFAYSTDGTRFTPLGPPFRLTWGYYRGDRAGVFCYNNERDAGHVDVDWFHYRYSKPEAAK
jgi:beta-xylosidase